MFMRCASYIFVGFAIVSLTGCSFLASLEPSQPSQPGQTDQPVEARSVSQQTVSTGNNTVELSPEEVHAKAKALVNPAKNAQQNQYVKNVKDSKPTVSQKEPVRLARAENAIDRAASKQKQFKGFKDSVRENSAFERRAAKSLNASDRVRAPDSKTLAAIDASAGANVSVKRVRAALHPGKTRLVFDLTGPADFKYELDNANNLLLIRLSADGWEAETERIFAQSKIFRAYAAKSAKNGGTIVALKLQKPGKVLFSQKLGKSEQGYHRVFFDVAPL